MFKRTWRAATAVPQSNGYALALDGVAKTTPAGAVYLCPTLALAEALAAEWNAAPPKFDPRNFSLSQLVATAHDIVAPRHAIVAAEVASYAANDLLCLRDEQPVTLAERQAAIWQPYLDWAVQRFGARLQVATGLSPAVQEAKPQQILHDLVGALPPLQLTVLQQATALTGSLILGLALLTGHKEPASILAAAELESLFQREQWGEDAEALARQEELLKELTLLARFTRLADRRVA
ncbi:MAG: ATPase [Alphaproteobacteria bacterium]|nr:ATPase [Alphaproteobacteria bacterium]